MRLASLALLALTACPDDGYQCESEERPSVQVTVVGSDGEPLVPENMEWSLDGAAAVDATCDSSEGCSEFLVGTDEVGAFTVSADWCDLSATETVVVQRTRDRCNIETQEVTLTVDTAECIVGDIELRLDVDSVQCEQLTSDKLWVELQRDGATMSVKDYACDDAPILLRDVSVGAWSVQVRDQEEPRLWRLAYNASEFVDVEVTPNSYESLNVVLACVENTEDGGCD